MTDPFRSRHALITGASSSIGRDALARGRASVVAGTANAAMVLGTHFVPRSLTVRFAFRAMKR